MDLGLIMVRCFSWIELNYFGYLFKVSLNKSIWLYSSAERYFQVITETLPMENW